MSKLKIKVTKQNDKGRNSEFEVNGQKNLSRAQTVKIIKSTPNPGYHVRKINGLDTPVSNPDNSSRNNLG